MLTRRQFLKMCMGTVLASSFSPFAIAAETSSGTAVKEIPVLLYHRVGPTTDPLTVPAARFEQDIKALSGAGYHTISLEQFAGHLRGEAADLPDQPLLITFDDGYRDNYENAFPILQRYGYKGTFYIITGMVGQKERVTPEHIREMVAGGMSMGSHTVNHLSLAELSPRQAEEELTASKKTLEDILGKRVDSVSYPKGSFDEHTMALAKSIGYDNAFTVKYGTCARKAEPYTLKRIPIFRFDKTATQVMSRYV